MLDIACTDSLLGIELTKAPWPKCPKFLASFDSAWQHDTIPSASSLTHEYGLTVNMSRALYDLLSPMQQTLCSGAHTFSTV